jgi:DUF4097 and DUF4098 domain-containing protein YvlB
MVKFNQRNGNTLRLSALLSLIAFGVIAHAATPAIPNEGFERTYTPSGRAHLTISNINGEIRVTAWRRKFISVKADSRSSVSIKDDVAGDDITITVKRGLSSLSKVDFDIYVPADSSLTLKNIMGDITAHGVTGPIGVNSYDSNIRLIDVASASVDVKVTSGNIVFDGDLRDGGIYSLQTIKGDIDVTLPVSTSFTLSAKALSENISLGEFLSSLTGSSRGPKGISGTHRRGNSRLNLTAFAGRILLHKK